MSRSRIAVVALAFVGFEALPAQQTPAFTASQILSYPFPWSLTTAPTGGGIAWVFNEGGPRNVWVALPNANGMYTSRRLTSFTEDDGQDIEHVAWSANGRTIYYTRNGYGGAHGSGPSLSRVSPLNTASLASGAPPIEVWSVPAAGGTPRRIGPGQAPVPNPRNGSVAYLNDGQIWLAPADGSTPRQLVVDRERSEALTWSPDGTRLAFLSSRNGHTIIGIHTAGAKRITWVAPTLDNDREPRWSPDGTKLAFFRMRASGGAGGRGGGRAGGGGAPGRGAGTDNTPTWQIRVWDLATGVDKQVFAAPSGLGSRFQGFVEGSNLIWAGDRLVFPWERTGWIRLYSVSSSGGGQAIALTPDSEDVFTANASRDGKLVLYGGNEGDHDRRHIFQVAPDGSSPRRQLTRGIGVEDRPMTTSTGRITALRSDPRQTMMPFVLEADGTMRNLAQQAVPADFPASKLVIPQVITYRTPDGATISGQLFVPANRTGRMPAILFHHGGPGNRQMFPAWDPFEVHSRLYAANQYLAARGYIVLSTNYRRGTGYGNAMRNPQRPANVPDECEVVSPSYWDYTCDILGAVEYLKSRPDVDPARLGIWGGSNGGRLASAGAIASPDFKAVVRYEGTDEPVTGNPAVSRWTAPVLMISTDNGSFLSGETSSMAAIRSNGRNVHVENYIIPDDIHFLMRKESWIQVYETMAEFLDRYLKP